MKGRNRRVEPSAKVKDNSSEKNTVDLMAYAMSIPKSASGRDWLDLDIIESGCGLFDNLPEYLRLEIGNQWRNEALNEISLANCIIDWGKFLLILSAPVKLVEVCLIIAAEKLRHARYRFSVAYLYGSMQSSIAFWPEGLCTPAGGVFSGREELLNNVGWDVLLRGCLSEKINSELMKCSSSLTENYFLMEIFLVIHSDEKKHANEIWNVFEWFRNQMGFSEKCMEKNIVEYANRMAILNKTQNYRAIWKTHGRVKPEEVVNVIRAQTFELLDRIRLTNNIVSLELEDKFDESPLPLNRVHQPRRSHQELREQIVYSS